jgi:hypothetical protein
MERRRELKKSKKGILMFAALAISLALVLPAFADDGTQDQKAETKNLRKEIVRLKYVRAQDIYRILQTYVSRDGYIRFQNEMPYLLTIGETLENVDKILDVIREIDVKPADVLFTVQLILGTAGETDKGAEAMPGNDPIIKELRSLLKYNTYSLLDTSLVRALDRQDSEVRLGEKAEFELWLKPKVIKDEKASLIQTEVRLRQVRIAGTPPGATSAKPEYITTDLIGTTLNIKSGDKTVVGVSKLDGSGKGLILIISGKIVD